MPPGGRRGRRSRPLQGVARTALTSGSASTEDLSPPDEVDSLVFTLSPRSAQSGPRGGDSEPLPAVAPPGGLDVVCARYVLDIARELGDVRQLAALLGGPRLGRPANGGGERFVVRVQREPPTLQHEPEMADCLETGQQLPVESLSRSAKTRLTINRHK
jgi:hypothetical protein